MSGFEGKYYAKPVPGSVYGHVLGLIKSAKIYKGEVVDFGCGYGPIAEPLQDLNFEYLGLDLDSQAINHLRNRGFKAEVVDLKEEVKSNYFAIFLNKSIRILLLLDVIEHLHPSNTKLKELIQTQDFDYLIISVPNVTHRKVLNSLIYGTFYYEETGIFDKTHLTFYSRKSLNKLIYENNLEKVLENNTHENSFVPKFNKNLKSLIKYSLANIINILYKVANKDSEVLQFIWLLKKQNKF